MPNLPVPMDKATLLKILDDIRILVDAGDSYEGSIEYLMPGPGDPEDAEFMVRGAYRIGNLQGQGGMRLIGKIE